LAENQLKANASWRRHETSLKRIHENAESLLRQWIRIIDNRSQICRAGEWRLVDHDPRADKRPDSGAVRRQVYVGPNEFLLGGEVFGDDAEFRPAFFDVRKD
jgi:hypothetical protein